MVRKDTLLKAKQFLLIGYYFSMLLWLVSCQKPEVDIQLPGSEEAFTIDSDLGRYIYGISLLDGSVDNIIDNASNLKVSYPIDVIVKGEPYRVSSATDLAPIQKEYDLNPYFRNFMAIEFPIEVTRWDHSKLVIESQLELEAFNSISTRLHEDIECVDFNYPVSLAIYDMVNQKASTVAIEDDESLFTALNNFDKNQLINFQFPISVSIGENIIQVLNNNELQQIIEGELSICEENDRWYYNKDIILSSISLNLTDAPYPIDLIDEANVLIDRIDVKTGAANDSVPFITLFNDTLTFDLTELTNGVTSRLSEIEIPVGAYQYFRVYVERGSVLLKDGRQFDLKVPSGNSIGILLKPDYPIVVSEDGPNDFLFDFDLSRSFIPRGNPNDNSQISGFNFRPVIKISKSTESGELSGRVTSIPSMPLDDVQITLFAADTINTVTFSSKGGRYTFLGLTAGEYTLVAEKVGFEVFVSDISISKNEQSNSDFVMSEL